MDGARDVRIMAFDDNFERAKLTVMRCNPIVTMIDIDDLKLGDFMADAAGTFFGEVWRIKEQEGYFKVYAYGFTSETIPMGGRIRIWSR